jgi:hypothetical protein
MSSLDERRDPSLDEPSARVAHTGAKMNPGTGKHKHDETPDQRQQTRLFLFSENFEMARCTPAGQKIEQKIDLETKNHCNRE